MPPPKAVSIHGLHDPISAYLSPLRHGKSADWGLQSESQDLTPTHTQQGPLESPHYRNFQVKTRMIGPHQLRQVMATVTIS